MIVEPDFLDHWKTKMLARMLGTELAPIYVIRLWAHCQQRKTDRFTGWNAEVLSSVCRWDGDGLTLWNAMLQTYTEMDGNDLVVHGWREANAGLFSAWENGKLGGRPKKVNGDRPFSLENNPPVNRSVTHRQPIGEPIDKIRLDKIEETEAVGASAKPAPLNDEEFLKTLEADSAYADIDVRREFSKMRTWCVVNNKRPTRRRFINWLNRADKPMSTSIPVVSGSLPRWKEIEVLEQAIQSHPANWESVRYDAERVTEEMKAELKAKRARLKELKGEGK